MAWDTGWKTVQVKAGDVELEGALEIAADARGLVLFAHGSGSSRFSPRNQSVARRLNAAGLGTLLFDLLTPEEEQVDLRSAEVRFDIPFLARRVADATAWAASLPEAAGLRIGLFGSSTGAAAALVAAARRPDLVGAVVSRGGRPDLAGEALAHVKAATLFIVGGADAVVLGLNHDAYQLLSCPRHFEIVPGAGHLFEEPGALDTVASLAADWFSRHLAPAEVGAETPPA